MKTFKKVLSIIMISAIVASLIVMTTVSTGATATGAGLAEWALKAYNEGWDYVWGGTEPGGVDCSGLIWSYCGGNRLSMLDDAKENGRDWGYVSDGIPNVHGLGLARPGHVGVYIGDGMEVDARGSAYGVCYDPVGGWNSWDCWFKLTAVSYTENGWEEFNGDSYYYVNGEYLVDTSRTIDGTTYYFDSTGACSSKSAASSSSGSSSSSESSGSGSSSSSDNSGVLKNGSTGSLVEELQKRLQELGYYNGAIDGFFGDLTENAFRAFQTNAGLYADGIAGEDVNVLYSDDAPANVTAQEKAEDEPEAVVEDVDVEDNGAEVEADVEAAVLSKKSDLDLADTGVEEDELAAEGAAPEEAKAEETETTGEISYSLGDFADEIVGIQERLVDLGYLSAEPDGEYGAQTETAVKDFQNNNKLMETGIVDEITYNTLFSEDAIEMPAAASTGSAQKTVSDKRNLVNSTPVQSNTAVTNPSKTTTPGTAPNTETEKKTSEITSKSLAGVTDNVDLQKNAKTTNYEFILWLAIMIVVMLITFAVVFTIEKKKARAAARSRRYY